MSASFYVRLNDPDKNVKILVGYCDTLCWIHVADGSMSGDIDLSRAQALEIIDGLKVFVHSKRKVGENAVKMLANLILVRPEMWTEQKQCGIILPQKSTKNFARGEVLGTGPGLVMADGSYNKVDINPGQRILYYKSAAVTITIDEQEHHIVQEREVLAILEPGDFADTTGDDNATV